MRQLTNEKKIDLSMKLSIISLFGFLSMFSYILYLNTRITFFGLMIPGLIGIGVGIIIYLTYSNKNIIINKIINKHVVRQKEGYLNISEYALDNDLKQLRNIDESLEE